MEEQVGQWLQGLAVRLARDDFPDARVVFPESAALWFRAFGGDPALAVQRGADSVGAHARGLWQRIAGVGDRSGLAWLDAQALRLPPSIARYPDAQLNHDLYFWLTALAATSRRHARAGWWQRNQLAAAELLDAFPGLRRRYRRLVDAELRRRPDPAPMAADESARELAIRQALLEPGSVADMPQARRAWHPVAPWLRPDLPGEPPGLRPPPRQPARGAAPSAPGDGVRRRARRVAAPQGRGGLFLPRAETLFSLAQYTPMEIGEHEDDDGASAAADDLDMLQLGARDATRAKAVRMQLDIEPADDAQPSPAGPGWQLPEWDWRSHTLRPARCVVRETLPAHARPCEFPTRLQPQLRRLQRMLAALRPQRERLRGQPDGAELDIDRYLDQRLRGEAPSRVHVDARASHHDLSCLLLADWSLSTEATLGDGRQVIDVLRDGLMLFAQTLSAVGDRFAIYGFNSHGRADVRLHPVKTFEQGFGAAARGRIAAAAPGDYTRMGAAIRAATQLLDGETTRERLLLLLSDGKPNDCDAYEGRYGLEDTRHAFVQARRQGLRPFCVTIDQQAEAYLPHLFGRHDFVIIRNAAELPQRLTMLYAQLAR